jgi:hypothetical protein
MLITLQIARFAEKKKNFLRQHPDEFRCVYHGTRNRISYIRWLCRHIRKYKLAVAVDLDFIEKPGTAVFPLWVECPGSSVSASGSGG